jgi:hypothetical protein
MLLLFTQVHSYVEAVEVKYYKHYCTFMYVEVLIHITSAIQSKIYYLYILNKSEIIETCAKHDIS